MTVGANDAVVVLTDACRLLRRRVGPVAWVVAEDLLLDSRPDGAGLLVVETNIRRIAAQVALSKDTVARALSHLVGLGLVRRRRVTTGAGRFAASVYVLNPFAFVGLSRMPCPAWPCPADQDGSTTCPAEPDGERPCPENRDRLDEERSAGLGPKPRRPTKTMSSASGTQPSLFDSSTPLDHEAVMNSAAQRLSQPSTVSSTTSRPSSPLA